MRASLEPPVTMANGRGMEKTGRYSGDICHVDFSHHVPNLIVLLMTAAYSSLKGCEMGRCAVSSRCLIYIFVMGGDNYGLEQASIASDTRVCVYIGTMPIASDMGSFGTLSGVFYTYIYPS